MQDVLVAVSKHGLSEYKLKGLRALDGREYEHLKQFYADIDKVMRVPGANVKVIFGFASDWAKFLSNEPFNNGAYIYFTIKAESLAKF